MTWVILRGLLLSLLLLLLFSLQLSGEVVLTDEEYQMILTELEGSIQDLETSEKVNSELKKDLTNSEKIIVMLRDEATISANIISLLKMESDLQLTSLKMQRGEQIIRDLKMFGLGVLSGGVIGVPAGIKIGVSF